MRVPIWSSLTHHSNGYVVGIVGRRAAAVHFPLVPAASFMITPFSVLCAIAGTVYLCVRRPLAFYRWLAAILKPDIAAIAIYLNAR